MNTETTDIIRRLEKRVETQAETIQSEHMKVLELRDQLDRAGQERQRLEKDLQHIIDETDRKIGEALDYLRDIPFVPLQPDKARRVLMETLDHKHSAHDERRELVSMQEHHRLRDRIAWHRKLARHGLAALNVHTSTSGTNRHLTQAREALHEILTGEMMPSTRKWRKENGLPVPDLSSVHAQNNYVMREAYREEERLQECSKDFHDAIVGSYKDAMRRALSSLEGPGWGQPWTARDILCKALNCEPRGLQLEQAIHKALRELKPSCELPHVRANRAQHILRKALGED